MGVHQVTHAVSVALGLGNPGARYAKTRHNLGMMVVDQLAAEKDSEFQEGDGEFVYCRVGQDGIEYLLAKPTVFMNESGRAVIDLCRSFGLGPEQLLVICDDCSLPLGKIRLRLQGSDGGHHGLASIIAALGTDAFARLRLGIGANPAGVPLELYVLTDFLPSEQAVVRNMIADACRFVEDILCRRMTVSAFTASVTDTKS